MPRLEITISPGLWTGLLEHAERTAAGLRDRGAKCESSGHSWWIARDSRLTVTRQMFT